MSRTVTPVKPVVVAAPQPKARKAKTQAEAPQAETIHAADVDEQDAATLFQRMREAADRYWAALKQPTWKRRIFAMLAGIVTFSAVYYYGMQLLEMLAVAMLMFSGPGFLAFLVIFIGMLAIIVTGVTLGNWVTAKVMVFEYSNAKKTVTGFFGNLKRTLGFNEPTPQPAQ